FLQPRRDAGTEYSSGTRHDTEIPIPTVENVLICTQTKRVKVLRSDSVNSVDDVAVESDSVLASDRRTRDVNVGFALLVFHLLTGQRFGAARTTMEQEEAQGKEREEHVDHGILLFPQKQLEKKLFEMMQCLEGGPGSCVKQAEEGGDHHVERGPLAQQRTTSAPTSALDLGTKGKTLGPKTLDFIASILLYSTTNRYESVSEHRRAAGCARASTRTLKAACKNAA
ncbi:unnamed protein product, partial [Amoebophrya sp. A120]